MTRERLGGEGLSSGGDFEELREEQRARSRAAGTAEGASDGAGGRDAASSFAASSGFQTRFTGYETERRHKAVGAVAQADGGYLVKLAESPFYAAGGGQIADVGTIECEHGDCRALVRDVFRLGDDQALAVVVEEGALHEGEEVVAVVDHPARHATECNHTATHLLEAALRERLGSHVRQAGSYVGPDKLRFDFSHSKALTAQELRDVEDQVNAWIARNDPVRPVITTLDEAKRLGAMALFGEKYGEVVRMVEVGSGEHSRELCGGTHVRSTAEIGVFHILGETSSAANVRRIEALTGPAAAELLRERDRLLGEVAATLRTRPEEAPAALQAREAERRELEQELKAERAGASAAAVILEALLDAACLVVRVTVDDSSAD